VEPGCLAQLRLRLTEFSTHQMLVRWQVGRD
jgi:hypothetical protein